VKLEVFFPNFSQANFLLKKKKRKEKQTPKKTHHLFWLYQALASTEVAECREYTPTNKVFNPLSICVSL